MTETRNTSTGDVVTACVTNLVLLGIFLVGFFLLRLKFKRIYQPKSSFDLTPELIARKPDPLPREPIGWLRSLVSISFRPDYIIEHAGLDGYLFVRYIGIIAMIALGGTTSFIILFPANSVNGKGESGLDRLGISNCGSPGTYYAHVVVSWLYYGMIMFVLYRELYFYVNLRNLVQTSPAYAKRLSSRTVIFQTVTDQYLDEEQFFKLFEGVKRVWVARGQKSLATKVKKRDNLAMELEGALNDLLSKAMKVKLKADKKGQTIEPADEMVFYVPQKKRPTMRKGFLFFGEKLDIIEHCKEELPKMNSEIEELQQSYRTVKPMNSIAVEFENQYYAQLAYQTRIHDQPFHFTPKHIGVNPENIVWANMRLFWWERLPRTTAATAAIVTVIIFWAIPVAFVGLISNLTYLTNKLTFLKFIYKLPKALLGLVTSLLPTIMLTLLMMALPMFIRAMGKLRGEATEQGVELFTQQSYFAFQVIQVFLVTTISSSIASTATQILENPSSAMKLLSSNVPKASNFYISYMALQGFSISGGALLQIVTLILFFVMGSLFDSTPRKKWERFTTLNTYKWGTTFPVYSNLAVIFLTYSIISPIIMLFTFAGYLCLYFTYLYNIIFVNQKGIDSMGKHYPRALFQTLVGVYLGEGCLLGLFIFSKSWGSACLEGILLGITIWFHSNLSSAFDELLSSLLPNTVMRPLDGKSETLSWAPNSSSMLLSEGDRITPTDYDDVRSPFADPDEDSDDPRTIKNTALEILKGGTIEDLASVPLLADGEDYSSSTNQANSIIKFFKPSSYLNFYTLREYIPISYYEMPKESQEWVEHAYDYPDVSAKCPILWIPRDPMGLSTAEIENLRGIIKVSDEYAWFNEKGKIEWSGSPPTDDDNILSKIDSRKKYFMTEDDKF